VTTLPLTLACGPYLPFDEGRFWMVVVTFTLLKPVAYFAFIHAFRYRVNRPVPMSFRRAAMLALARAGLGLLLLGVAVTALLTTGNESLLMWSWFYLYGGRAAAWFIVGRWGAVLRGRRLIGWVVSGSLLNAAFDVAAVGGLLDGWLWPAGILVCLIAFIGILDRVGRRTSLKARFADARFCLRCRYDLTGNLSGCCPECSTPVTAAA